MMQASKGMKSLTYQWKDETGEMQKMVYPSGESGSKGPPGAPSNADKLAAAYSKDGGMTLPGSNAEYSDQADRIDPARVQRREDDRAARAAKKAKKNP